MNSGLPQFTKGIRGLVVATVAVWILQLIPGVGALVSGLCELVPYKTFGQLQVWRLLTYAFLHDTSTPFHILFNLFTLWMFGAEIEELWGTRRFVVFYLCAAVGSGLFSLVTALSPLLWFTPVIGASGAVLALLTVYALYFPRRQLLLFFLFPVNVVVAVAIFGAISLFGAARSWGNVSHLTHLGGIAVGLAYVKLFPAITDLLERAKSRAAEAQERAEQRKKNAERNYFESVVDPILKKISRSGMDSLTAEEKKTLEEASKRKKDDEGEQGRIIPFRRNPNRDSPD
jgi:membrane associated rhomboid family serine protease